MKKNIVIVLFVVFCYVLSGITCDFKNSLTINGSLFEKSSSQRYHLNVDYKPNFFLTIFQHDKYSIDTEQVANLMFSYGKSTEKVIRDIDYNLYRSWLRLLAPQYELRLGRQKINFGPSQILRPLKWFDTINPTDPTQTSKGVDALLGRYYFLNNTNLWLWAINPEKKKLLTPETVMKTKAIEFGGRIQYPFKYCEAALTYHHRTFENSDFSTENRFGLDCRWDWEIGFWFETMISRFSGQDTTYFSHFFTGGADYTFNIGNGLGVLAEHMFYSKSTQNLPEPFAESYATAILITYPINLFDSTKFIVSYDWISENFSYFASYGKNYDYVNMYINVMGYPDATDHATTDYGQEGKSVQLLVEINF